MSEKPRTILTLPKCQDEQRSEREILLETHHLVQQLALQSAKTLEELERAMLVVDQSIAFLGLSARAEQALSSIGITTVRQLLLRTPTNIVHKEKIGRVARNEIVETLAVHGLRLACVERPCEKSRCVDDSGNEPPVQSEKSLMAAVSAPITGPQPVVMVCDSSESEALREGDLVRHPVKPDWGAGQILSITSDGYAAVRFSQVGEKHISLKHVSLERIPHSAEATPTSSEINGPQWVQPSKVLCTNCGQPTYFTDNASAKRHELGWCDSCFKQSQRTFKDGVTGETRYFDELRTIDGLSHRWFRPK